MSPKSDMVLSIQPTHWAGGNIWGMSTAFLRNVIVKYFSCLLERYLSLLIHTVCAPKLNAMTVNIGASVVEVSEEHLLWDGEHGAWTQVFCRSADLALSSCSSLSKDNNRESLFSGGNKMSPSTAWCSAETRGRTHTQLDLAGNGYLRFATLLTVVWLTVTIASGVCICSTWRLSCREGRERMRVTQRRHLRGTRASMWQNAGTVNCDSVLRRAKQELLSFLIMYLSLMWIINLKLYALSSWCNLKSEWKYWVLIIYHLCTL